MNVNVCAIRSRIAEGERVVRLGTLTLHAHTYDRQLGIQLATVAGDRHGARWQTRTVAIALLESHLLHMRSDALAEHDWWFVALGMKHAGVAAPLDADVLRQGYSTRELEPFVVEFRRRLCRAHRWLPGAGPCTLTPELLSDLLDRSSQVCTLTLARYFLSPDEVAGRILRSVTTTGGVADPHVPRTGAQPVLPAYEAAIADRVCRPGLVFWVSPGTSRRLNALVEHPVGTAALVIKPPGSDVEIEIKRTGLRGLRPIDVVVTRDGARLPLSHTLQGGCLGKHLRFEAHAAARFATLYRLVWRHAAPISTVRGITKVIEVPTANGPRPLIHYLSEPDSFGPEFSRMRADMWTVTRALGRHSAWQPPPLPGRAGETAALVAHMAPAQGVLHGTTSFRLDLVADLLGADGPARYFGRDSEQTRDPSACRQLADTLLDEVLGRYEPSRAPWSGYDAHVRAALEVPANRRRADFLFVDLMERFGTLWATLLALRGYSNGESFVARNVGLRAVWDEGDWRVRPVFMDHDDLHVPRPGGGHAGLATVLRGMGLDHRYIFGVPSAVPPRGSVERLEEIYRCEPAVVRTGHARLATGMRHAYQHTCARIGADAGLQRELGPDFLRRHADLDDLLACYRRCQMNRPDAQAPDAQGPSRGPSHGWPTEMAGLLTRRGYSTPTAHRVVVVVRQHEAFVTSLVRLLAEPA